ncbi:MAG: 16S rRNA (guanine(966)-N(2))-methyltransferase RsmD [Solirubrobacteraceae bacterium]|nr:MAG: 16S rRNA (guanine(966)-N(2))-methyltransferase RsmD [Solirubrobacterales bacterium]
MRVIAGALGGRRLQAPPGRSTRPTSERVREALFAILGSVARARVLDLFAGTGALGIEALSRGARRATFVESAPAVARVLSANLAALGLREPVAAVLCRDALQFLREAEVGAHPYDLVFLDPPYARAGTLGPTLSRALPAVLAPGARVVSESDPRAPLGLDLALLDERRYGDTLIRFHESL